MTDFHVHIGQYAHIYYYADRVFKALKAAGMNEVWFSSTTNCIFCKESSSAQVDDAILASAPTARELYEGVRGEVKDALNATAEIGMKAHALYWLVPDVHFALVCDVADSESAGLGTTVEKAMTEIPYDGFKIHPRAQKWDLTDERTAALAEAVFSYAESHGNRILLHCDEDFTPRLFEPLIASHPKATVQLAHSRPLSDTLYMLRRYPNVVADTAMVDGTTVSALREAEFSRRICYGSDFPITHWRKIQPKSDPTTEELAEFLKKSHDF